MTLALLAAVAFVAAAVQTATGLGFALIAGPALLAALEPEQALLTLTLLGLLLSSLVLFGERRRASVDRREVAPILAAALPGAIAGVLVLRALSKPLLQVVVGAAVVAATLVQMRLRARIAVPAPAPGNPRLRVALGVGVGALATSSGVTGPPLALWLARRGLAPAALRDSLTALFQGLGVIALVVLVPAVATGGGSFDWRVLASGAGAVLAGHALGHRGFARIAAGGYERVVLAIALVAGVACVAAGLASA